MNSDQQSENSGSSWLVWVVGLVICVGLFWFFQDHSPAPVEPLVEAPAGPDQPVIIPPAPMAEPESVKTNYQQRAVLVDRRPIEKPANGYATSASCHECHPNQHQSWHDSYHSTMTQVATPATVLGNFAGQEFEFGGGEKFTLGRSGDEYWVEVENHPQMKSASGGKMRLPIVMTTGSHHMQVYWFSTGQGRTLGILPMVHLKGEERWIPRDAAFLQPPDKGHSLEMGRWNYTCNTCHTTDPRANFQKESHSYDTEVSEFGIACESCHGPAEQHVAYQRKKKETPEQLGALKDQIVNPATLDHVKSSQVCGACHVAHRRVDPKGRFTNYIPGTDYDKARLPLRMEEEFLEKILEGATNKAELKKGYEEQMLSQFWRDGTIRVSGREYNGMLRSKCHTAGEMSCLSCHSLHQKSSDKRGAKEWADDLLQPSKNNDLGCLQCHEKENYLTKQHTHHELDSSGSRCFNCHMPHTTYGLLKAIRSHSIDSPLVSAVGRYDRPNACNLCHLDKTLEWTAGYLADWFQQPKPALNEEQKTVAAGPLWVLKGDAGLRALMAWHLSWQPAHEAAGTDWIPPYLAVLMDDDYHAVRVIASRTLRQFADYRHIAYDFLAPAQNRRLPALQLIGTWQQKYKSQLQANPELMIAKEGKPEMKRFQQLLNGRDRRPILLAE